MEDDKMQKDWGYQVIEARAKCPSPSPQMGNNHKISGSNIDHIAAPS